MFSHEKGADNIEILDSVGIDRTSLLHDLPTGIRTININTKALIFKY